MKSNSLAGQRILVVEDEMIILLMIEDVLADHGCESVTAAGTVARALALIDSQKFDVAMLDVNLNGNPSYPIADALAGRGVPFFFATGYGDHGLKESYRDRAVLRKPFNGEHLVAMMLAGLRL
jgi:CheY-like chemotaxis protein